MVIWECLTIAIIRIIKNIFKALKDTSTFGFISFNKNKDLKKEAYAFKNQSIFKKKDICFDINYTILDQYEKWKHWLCSLLKVSYLFTKYFPAIIFLFFEFSIWYLKERVLILKQLQWLKTRLSVS